MPVETGNSQDEDDNGLNAAIDMADIDENVEEVDEDSFSIPDESESTHRQSILQQLNLVDQPNQPEIQQELPAAFESPKSTSTPKTNLFQPIAQQDMDDQFEKIDDEDLDPKQQLKSKDEKTQDVKSDTQEVANEIDFTIRRSANKIMTKQRTDSDEQITGDLGQ